MNSRLVNSVMANSCDAQQRARVDRVVLVDEKGVEQLVVACDAMNLAERQVLVLEGVVVDTLQLV